jgi:hypothetical protein
VTEQEWLDSADPTPMLEFLRARVGDRKLRLLAVACCRRIWHLLTDERSRMAVEVAENLADGWCSDLYRKEAVHQSLQAFFDSCGPSPAGHGVAHSPAAEAAHVAVGDDRPDFVIILVEEAKRDGSKDSILLREIFGNPFRPVVVNPSWLTPTVVSLAQAIYEERAFDSMPVLGDALLDAGCDNQDILQHCRQPAEHVRGCWVVDLVLGKG